MHFTDGTIGWGMVVRNHESMASLAATKKGYGKEETYNG
jgi:hypothetical protein